jgi:hypothetical protein
MRRCLVVYDFNKGIIKDLEDEADRRGVGGKYGYYRTLPVTEDLSKKVLIGIILKLNELGKHQIENHHRDLDTVIGARSGEELCPVKRKNLFRGSCLLVVLAILVFLSMILKDI